MTFSMRWLSGRDGSRESQVKHFSESCAGEWHHQGKGGWRLHRCPAVPGPCRSHARARWAHLEVADDAVLLGPVQPAGGGGTQARGSPHQQVPGGRVAAAAGAAMARVRLLPAPCCRHPHCREQGHRLGAVPGPPGCPLPPSPCTPNACPVPSPPPAIPSRPVPASQPTDAARSSVTRKGAGSSAGAS